MKDYDVIIIGGGVTGTAVLFALSNFSNVGSIALIEKYGSVALVNSSPKNNSQTLHFGDIETNYPLEKALPIQEAGMMIARYVMRRPERGLYHLTHKMVLAVGEAEVAAMTARYEQFKPHYPQLERWDRVELEAREPRVMIGRPADEPVVALVSPNGFAINYQRLSQSFLEDSKDMDFSCRQDYWFEHEVKSIEHRDGGYVVQLGDQELVARAVVVAAGPYSLLFAQSLGYGTELAMLPVAGSFYFSVPPVLNGKVYTVQDEQLPFAAVHGDPDVVVENETRFGPTAKVLPLLERHKYASMSGFFKTPIMTLAGLVTLLTIMRNRVIAKFIIKNLFYDWPLIGKWLYLKRVRKIVPSMKWHELRLGKGLGGIRPQIVDTKAHTLQHGESKIVGDNIIFNTTPSPGASVSLYNAEKDAQTVIEFLGEGFTFDQQAFDRQFRGTSTAVANEA